MRHRNRVLTRPAARSDWPQMAAIAVTALLGAAWFLAAERGVAGAWGFSLDDSWIYATFAKNLATGHGYSFNPGQPVAGATGPLYVFLLAACYSLFGTVIWPAKILGLACLVAAALFVHATVRRLLPSARTVPLLAGLIVAASPPLIWGALGGMEIPVYLLLFCAGLHAYTRQRWTLATLWWSIGVWLRPEGIFLATLSIFAIPRETLTRAWRGAVVAGCVIGLYLLFNQLVGGRPLPTSVGVKSHFGGNLGAREWSMFEQVLWLWGLSLRTGKFGPHLVLLVPAIAVGAVVLARRWPLPVLYFACFPLAFALASTNGGQLGRYLAYTIPVGAALGAIGLAAASGRASRRGRTVAFVLAGTLCLGYQAWSDRLVGIAHGWNVQNINAMHRYIAESIRKVASPGDTVAVNDVGAIGYFSGCYVVDLVGLVSPRRPFPENLARYRPKWLVIFPDWYQQYASIDPQTDQVVFYDADSTLKYSPLIAVRLRKNSIASRNTMYVYERLSRYEPGSERVEMVVH